ncbi:MAG: hypothetical protein CL454_02420 [Acidimicrobiaceae bacterium]|nr:hypothetical protein [Acidimicrobiaceae bacterium]
MENQTDLNPSQLNVLQQLGSRLEDRPQFDDDLQEFLKSNLDEKGRELSSSIPPNETLYISKYHLNLVMRCEKQFLSDRKEQFEWSVPTARGTISHKAIELSAFWNQPRVDPLTLVDEAIDRSKEGSDGLGKWLRNLSEGDVAQLRGDVNNRVASFLETWPPLEKQWRPMLEAPVRVDLANGNIILSGKVDLSLGRPLGSTAGKVIVDFKTGNFYPAHREDVRFYALLETIRIGVPPRLVATYYLDRAEFSPEVISEQVLEASLNRVVDGMTKMIEILYQKRKPELCSWERCSWCSEEDI